MLITFRWSGKTKWGWPGEWIHQQQQWQLQESVPALQPYQKLKEKHKGRRLKLHHPGFLQNGSNISLVKCCNYSVIVSPMLSKDTRCNVPVKWSEVKNLVPCPNPCNPRPNDDEDEKMFTGFYNKELALLDTRNFDHKTKHYFSLSFISLILHLIQNFSPFNCPSEVSSSAMDVRGIKLGPGECKSDKHLTRSFTHLSVCLVLSCHKMYTVLPVTCSADLQHCSWK